MIWFVPLLAFGTSYALTRFVLRFALRLGFVDVPNYRSSHSRTTPRGGGLSIVVVFSAILCGAYSLGLLPARSVVTIVGGGLLVAAVSLLDDRYDVPVVVRFAAHVLAVVFALLGVGAEFNLELGALTVDPPWITYPLAALYLLWLLNLYNFMDGIDGLAGAESVTTFAGTGGALAITGNSELGIAFFSMAAASAGFLTLNWPPARIFMGDVGSAFLGFVFGALSIALHSLRMLDFWVIPILLGVFIVDATVTLLRRLARGERVYLAHRSHAYQRLSRRYESHQWVTAATVVINVFWLFPLACLVATGLLGGFFAALLAFAPLLAIALACGAGKADQ